MLNYQHRLLKFSSHDFLTCNRLFPALWSLIFFLQEKYEKELKDARVKELMYAEEAAMLEKVVGLHQPLPFY